MVPEVISGIRGVSNSHGVIVPEGEIALQYDMKIDKIQVMSDHVHLSVGAPPGIAPSLAVQILKSVSTKLLFKQYKFLKKYYWGGEVFVPGVFRKKCGTGTNQGTNQQVY